MKRIILILSVVLIVCGALPLCAGGFFEVVYSMTAKQTDDFDDALDDAIAYGILFGYETEIGITDFFFNVELGYEISDHEVSSLDDSDLYYRNHRSIIGVRFKYGGLGYFEPYIGFGKMLYIYYEASSDLDSLGFPDFKIDNLFAGFYWVIGMDFYFKEDGFVAVGVEYRSLEYPLKEEGSGSMDPDAGTDRLGLKFLVMF
jgi:hypothetical protein